MGGRNRLVSWIAGLCCLGVISGLVYLAVPMGPVLVTFLEDVLRAIVR